MRIVVQRCQKAKCTVSGNVTGEIKKGYMLLVGITHLDTIDDVIYAAKKVAHLRIFADDDGKMNKSILDVKGSCLSISQFTLYGDVINGNRPSFTESARPELALKLYNAFNDALRDYDIVVETGIFGADMAIDFINDGPVTILIDSKNR